MNVKEAVQKYIDRGWNIIPLAKGTKIAPSGLKLERFFNEKYPSDTISSDMNLGLITGKTSGLAVIDIDDETKKAFYLTNFPTSLIQKTPHGLHLFYQHNPNLPAVKKIDGGDFFNGNHYVVVAPSKFENLSYEWLQFGEPGVLPDDIFAEKPQIQIQSGKYTRQEIYELVNYAMVHGKPLDGAGNDTILYGSMILAGDGWSHDAILALMKTINAGRTQPESNKIVEGMVQRASEYAQNKKQPETKSSTPFEVLPYSEMLSKYSDYKASWLVDQWLPKSSVIMCSALPEMYKTWLSVDLAISVASGLPFLGTFGIAEKGNVLIVQQEDFGPEFIARFKTVERGKIARSDCEVILEYVEDFWIFTNNCYVGDRIFFHDGAELSFERPDSLDKLEQRIKEIGAVLCVIDPFYSLANSKDWFANAAETIRSRIKKIRNETGCTFFFVHHNKKTGSGDGNDRGQAYGSTLLNAAMEGQIGISRTSDMGATEVIAYRHFKTQKAGSPTKIHYHIDMYATNDTDAYFPEVSEAVFDNRNLIMDYLTDNGATSFSELFEVFQDRIGSKSTLTNLLKGMVGHGITQEGKRGKYSVEPDI